MITNEKIIEWDDFWDLAQQAMGYGWKDPGFTETFEETEKRAIDYLENLGLTVVHKPRMRG